MNYQFIKLTHDDTGLPLLVNISDVIEFEPRTNNTTKIFWRSTTCTSTVRETTDVIFNMINFHQFNNRG